MTFLSRKADYALLILSQLSQSAEGLSARAIAEKYELSRAFVANISRNSPTPGSSPAPAASTAATSSGPRRSTSRSTNSWKRLTKGSG